MGGVIGWLVALPLLVLAQDGFLAQFEAGDLTPLLGEPVDILLVVQVPVGYELDFSVVGASWGDEISIRETGDLTVEPVGGGNLYRLPLIVVPWRVGVVTTPPSYVTVQTGEGSDPVQLTIEPISFDVPSTLDDEQELRISRVVHWMPYPASVVWSGVGLAALVVIAGSAFMTQALTSRRTTARTFVRPVTRTLAQRTISRLNQLRSDAPDVVTQYMQMGDILRVFVRDLLGFAAQDMTTSELIDKLTEDQSLSAGRRKELAYLLEQADLAKFAPSKVFTPDRLSVLQRAVQWVQSVEQEVEA